ncbi:MAG: hypothetical protein ACLPLP_16445 [Mycobacterium sp.]
MSARRLRTGTPRHETLPAAGHNRDQIRDPYRVCARILNGHNDTKG